ncbi:SPOR domain-containing protein [Tropicimonas sp. TH_r6]|uniref:SPOR domain-containing protein n=1 Tax=Tropicimonas sp. TH_r6 TaxID=3082085 RepID=UPI002954B83C|nr:SPOR domain-containing protein [Tropicimonas sp. TH_r6]MDV7145055.1 SPOR domain-containing protein [Tropicimonas sp. TH_r6]
MQTVPPAVGSSTVGLADAGGDGPTMTTENAIWGAKAWLDNDAGLRVAASDLTGAQPVYDLPTLPKGYKYAFGTGRHNPNRGERTLAGRAQMNRIWTEDVPARLVDPQAVEVGLEIKGYKVPASSGSTYRASSKSATAEHHRNLQVGTFRSTDAAERAVKRLQARGISARAVDVKSAGRTLSAVQAGPFASDAQTRSALSTVRGAGYVNAYMQR